MKIKKNDTTITIKLPCALKKEAEQKLAEMGYSMSEFIREKLQEIIVDENKLKGKE
ncbi:hypothetical protein [Thermoanaerobacter sp. A7A]|uniref:hypothetical protein n=1 Tax=Thermoanaerobacter sp. A7A TaxID=1350366 RepID=UPI00040C23ED|nr:hypothetical protein [Thermoanaerobacter sp. A7A]